MEDLVLATRIVHQITKNIYIYFEFSDHNILNFSFKTFLNAIALKFYELNSLVVAQGTLEKKVETWTKSLLAKE